MKKFTKLKINESIGKFIENYYNSNDDVRNIINVYLKDKDTSVRISNAVDSLPENKKNELYYKVKEYIKGNSTNDPNIDVNTTQEINLSENIGGKGIFTSFLKVLTAINPNTNQKIDWDVVPSDYIIYFLIDNIEMETFKNIISRYSSLIFLTQKIDYNNENLSLFYGIDDDLIFKYGLIINSVPMIIGSVKMNKSTHNYLLKIDSKSNIGFRKFLLENDYNQLLIYTMAKKYLTTFDPGPYKRRTKFIINDSILEVGYVGYGTWVNGDMEQASYDKFVDLAKQFLLRFKYRSKIQYSVKNDDDRIILMIKNKD